MNRCTLGDVAHVVMGQSPDGSTYNKQGVGLPLLNGPAEFGTVSPVAVQWTSEPSKIAKPGDILFCVRGNTLGRQNLADKTYAIGRRLAAVRGREGKADTAFIGLWLRFQATALLAAGTGSTFPNVSADYLEKRTFPPIGVTEQRYIAAQLKTQLAAVEEARQAAQGQTTEVEALVLAIYHDAFADIVPVAIPPVFGVAPENWRWAKLSDLARLESGHTPSRSRSDWWGGNTSWVSLTEIRSLDGRWVEETAIKTNKKGIANSAARILPRGTVCFSRTASVGFVTIMGQPMATSQDFADWVCGDDLEPEFLMYALIRSRNELRALATGATHKTIYMPTLEEFHLCVPKREVQQFIVKDLKAKLAAVEQARQASQAQLKEIAKLPARLLAKVFEEH
ncbi:MAG: restriction endonuclease subunit S [Nitrospira sp.]|nr:restriction endonuclease subunit S [Nitrospira sp.]